jgi:chromosome segregation ATPase
VSAAEQLIKNWETRISELQTQKQQASQALTTAESDLAKAKVDRERCRRKTLFVVTYDNGCLDRNKALQGSLEQKITDLKATLTRLDADIAEAGKQREAALTALTKAKEAEAAAYAKMKEAEAAANPAVAQARAEAEVQASASKSKTLIIVGGVVAGVLILVIAVVAFRKN